LGIVVGPRRNERLQCGQPRVDPAGLAVAALDVEVGAAHRAQSLAVGAAERLHRQREQALLAHQQREIDLLVAVETGRRVVIGVLVGIAGEGQWQVAEVEAAVDRDLEGLEAAAARHFEARGQPASEPVAILVLVEHRIEPGRFDDPKVVLASERVGREHLRDGGLRLPDVGEVENHSQGPARLSATGTTTQYITRRHSVLLARHR
jgi:hypothetical protein